MFFCLRLLRSKPAIQVTQPFDINPLKDYSLRLSFYEGSVEGGREEQALVVNETFVNSEFLFLLDEICAFLIVVSWGRRDDNY